MPVLDSLVDRRMYHTRKDEVRDQVINRLVDPQSLVLTSGDPIVACHSTTTSSDVSSDYAVDTK